MEHQLLSSLVRNKLIYWWVILLAIVVFLAYGQTLSMYFWVDDWGMAYKMRYPEANIPNFGPGIFGDGAYRYNVTPFILLYPLLGYNATAYFAIGLAFYFFAALIVYLLAKDLSGKKLIGLISAAIFASGYIGSDAMYHLNNSYQLVHTATASALTVWLLLKYYKTNSVKYYFLALLLYTAILEFLFLRSHGVFLLVLSAAFLARVLYRKRFLPTVLKVTPFFLIWFYMFFLDPRTSKEYDGLGREDLLPSTINVLFKEKHFELFNNLLITLSSAVFPDQVLFSLYRFITVQSETLLYLPLALPLLAAFSLLLFLYIKYKLPVKALAGAALLLGSFFVYLVWSASQESAVWSPDKAQLFISAWFWAFLIILGSLYFLPNLRKRLYLAYFSLAWIVSNVVIYFIYTPTTNLASNTRYLIPAFIGTCILFGSIFSMFSKKLQVFVFAPLFIYCGFLISLTNERSTYLVENISNPAREHLKVIKNTVQNINENTIFYFEAASGSRFSKSELGGIPHLAIPIELGYKGRANIAVSYDELFFFLKERKVDIGNVHTFFAKGESLENTTPEFTKLALYSGKEHPIDKWTANTGLISKNICCITQTVYHSAERGTVVVNPILETNLNYPSMLPSLLTLELAVNPMSVKDFSFPFGNLTERYISQFDENILEKENATLSSTYKREEYIQYLLNEKDRLEFAKTTNVKANSSERTREENFINDGEFSFGWEARSIEWRKGTRPVNLVFSFLNNKRFSKFIWVNHSLMTTPAKYTISVSDDGNVWEAIKSVQSASHKERGEIIVDEFKLVEARYLKISIQDTYGGGNSAPAIDEAWVSQHFPPPSMEEREKLLFCPLCQAGSREDAKEIMLFYKPITQARVSWATDKVEYNIENAKSFSLIPDNQIRKYEIVLPAQGKTYQKIKLSNFAVPVEVSLLSASIRSLSLNELIEKDLIYDFAD